MYIPYFYKNEEWYYYDEEDGLKLTDRAPEKARESYRVYMGYYDEEEDANVYSFVPPELSLNFDESLDLSSMRANVEDIREGIWEKQDPDSKIWWLYNDEDVMCYSFDRIHKFYLPRDYPKMTKEQKEIFDKENPFWANFCKGWEKE